MQLTRQQKIYVAVLLLAGVAFVVDRWVIGHGPDEAAAAVPSKSRPAAARPAPGATPGGTAQGVGAVNPGGRVIAGSAAIPGAGTAGATHARSLAVRLQEVVKAEGLNLSAVPDAFQPSRRWDPPDMLIWPAPGATPGGTAQGVGAVNPGGRVIAGSAAIPGAGTAGATHARSLAVRLQEVVKAEGLNLSAVPDAFQPSRRWDPPDMLIPPA